VLIKNPVLSGQNRHIKVKYHLVHESASNGQIAVEFIGTEPAGRCFDQITRQGKVSSKVDNKSVIALIKNHVLSGQSNHIKVTSDP
jgi:hypothetical protein